MTQNTLDTPDCNTNNRVRSVFYTWNNPPNCYKDMLEEYFDKYQFQLEVGESGTPHVQGIGYFTNPRTFSSIIKKLPGIHIERMKNWSAALNYVTKKETSIEGTQCGNIVRDKIKDPLAGKSLYQYQTDIINIIEGESDDRTIHWYWESEGNVGKTSLAKHLCLKYDKECVFLSGKASDIKYGVFSWLKKKELKVCIFHYTRSVENYVSYEALESIKDGIFYNAKYESEMCIFNSPHIFVFANFPPDFEAMSADRWVVTEIKNQYNECSHERSLSDVQRAMNHY